MIPKLFHHIWINRIDPALPDAYDNYRETWIRHHPDWTFRLWNFEAIDFKLRRSDLLDRCGSYAQMADILRIEVLYEYGGVYVDTDFECFKPIDLLLEGARTAFCSENGLVISNSFLAAQAKSPLILSLLENFPKSLGGPYPNLETGPNYLTRQLLGFGFDERVRLLPTKYFYPYSMGEPRATAMTHPDAYAAHHWAHSWAPRSKTPLKRLRTALSASLKRISLS